MAWRLPTSEDLIAALSQVEVDEYKKSPEFESSADPTALILSDTAELVRGYCRRGENKGSLKMHPTEGYIPASLMNPAMDIAAFRVLKRFNLDITDPRKKAYDEAMQILRDISEEKIIPESYTDSEEDDESVLEEAVAGIIPLYAMEFNAHTLDKEEVFNP